MLRCVAAFAVVLAAPAKDGHAWHTTATTVFATQEREKKPSTEYDVPAIAKKKQNQIYLSYL